MKRTQRLSGRRREESGAAAVEFALVFLALLVPLMMGLLEYGWYFYSTQTTSSGARETARRLSVGDCQDSGDAQAYARQVANSTALTLTYGTTSTQNNTLPDVGEVLRVEVTSDGSLFEFLPLPNDGRVTRAIDTLVEDDLEDTPC